MKKSWKNGDKVILRDDDDDPGAIVVPENKCGLYTKAIELSPSGQFVCECGHSCQQKKNGDSAAHPF